MNKKAICKNCGVVNEISSESFGDENDDWLQCDLPLGFEWILPAGKITPVVGDPIYISGLGENLSRDDYLLKYNIDPEIAYQNMRQNMRGRMGRQPVSRILNIEKKQAAHAGSPPIPHEFFDDDDWDA
jgi:hypothetical protein